MANTSVADCVALSCQVTRKLMRATSLEYTTILAIIFILCYGLVNNHVQIISFNPLVTPLAHTLFAHPLLISICLF